MVDVKSFLTVGIDHPENFLDIARHLVEFMLCRLQDGGRLALITAQLEKHLSQKKAEDTKSSRHAAQQHYRDLWPLEVRDQHGNEENDGQHHQGDRSDLPDAP